MHAIRIDRTKPLADEPHYGHNRYHPDIAPELEAAWCPALLPEKSLAMIEEMS